ncbi:MAG: hypothetical protein IJR26_07660 [Bacteroidales bacterium]|nr:hypothetical protein [Bacteroidales bacterium]
MFSSLFSSRDVCTSPRIRTLQPKLRNIETSRSFKNKDSFAVSALTMEAIGRYNDNLDNWAYR